VREESRDCGLLRLGRCCENREKEWLPLSFLRLDCMDLL
jgi:hypothetical protein